MANQSSNMKIIGLVLAVIIVIASIYFVALRPEAPIEEPVAEVPEVEEPVKEPIEEPVEEPVEEPEVAFDLGGQTVTIASYRAEDKRKYFAPGGGGMGILEEVEKRFNVQIEFADLSWGGLLDEVMTSIAAGDPIGDIIYATNRHLAELAAEGALRPLDDILGDDYFASLPGMHSRMRELYSSFHGQNFGISTNGSFVFEMDIGSAQAIIWNKTMFEEAGLSNLNEIQNAGDWTWDKMKELAIALTKDTDGDGETDQWGIGSRLGPWPIDLDCTLISNNANIFRYVDNQPVYTLNEPEALEVFDFWREVQDLGVGRIGDVIDGVGIDLHAEFNDQKIGMFRIDLFAFPGHARTAAERGFDVGLVFYPKGPRAEQHYTPLWGIDVAALPKGVENPEEMVAIFNALFRTTSDYRSIDDETYEEIFFAHFLPYVEDVHTAETIRGMLHNPVMFDHFPGMDVEEVRLEWVRALRQGEPSPKSILDALEPVVQTKLDEAFGQ